MRILSLLILCILFFSLNRGDDSPHGPGFKINCSVCHSSKGWQIDKSIYSFDHNNTKMPLTGQHVETECRLCHPSLVFSEAKNQCAECHSDVHQSTTGSDCSRCHSTQSWLVSNISGIHLMSRFPLLGAHRTADCRSCHKSENPVRFEVPGINCIDCHRENYMATTNPNHLLSGLSQDCVACHPVNSFEWAGAGFNHNFFPLTQGHSVPKCIDCHKVEGSYTGLNASCYSCHENEYNATTNPDHHASGFARSCDDCHSLAPGWKPAVFDHTIFPLKLGHATPKCTDCHTGGNYTSTPTDCYACHKADYDNSVNPQHSFLGFSTSCNTCHTTNPGWKPASYRQHDSKFPIYSGHHNSTWSTCADCHKVATDYSIFTCIDCHEHNKTDMDRKHKGEVRGYSYVSTECFRCHPRGNAE